MIKLEFIYKGIKVDIKCNSKELMKNVNHLLNELKKNEDFYFLSGLDFERQNIRENKNVINDSIFCNNNTKQYYII